MDCSEFLRRYSEFRDGVLADPALALGMDRHVRECATCMRYDARVSRGVAVLRSVGEVEPSPGFGRELRRRLAGSTAAREPVVPAPAGIMAALMLVTAIALAWWETAERQRPTPHVAAEPTPREQPLPAIVANPGYPFVSFASPGVSAGAGDWRTPGASAPFATPVALPR